MCQWDGGGVFGLWFLDLVFVWDLFFVVCYLILGTQPPMAKCYTIGMTSDEAQPDQPQLWKRAAHGVLALYWLAIFTLTHVPISPPPTRVPNADKVAHLLMYGLLALFYFAARSTIRPLVRSDYLQGLLIFALYGVADELLQIPVGRTCDALDWVADIAGALAGTGLFLLVHKLRRR